VLARSALMPFAQSCMWCRQAIMKLCITLAYGDESIRHGSKRCRRFGAAAGSLFQCRARTGARAG
jgi:hypothetical protein